MNTQKVEERPKDLSILARDEEKKDIPRSILREEDEREAEPREGKGNDHNSIFFLVSVYSKNHTSDSSLPHYLPTRSPFC